MFEDLEQQLRETAPTPADRPNPSADLLIDTAKRNVARRKVAAGACIAVAMVAVFASVDFGRIGGHQRKIAEHEHRPAESPIHEPEQHRTAKPVVDIQTTFAMNSWGQLQLQIDADGQQLLIPLSGVASDEASAVRAASVKLNSTEGNEVPLRQLDPHIQDAILSQMNDGAETTTQI